MPSMVLPAKYCQLTVPSRAARTQAFEPHAADGPSLTTALVQEVEEDMFSWHPGLREVKIVRREKAITAVASTCAKFCPMHVRGPATLRSSPSDRRFGHI